jgi:anti-sigma B factor antagonist
MRRVAADFPIPEAFSVRTEQHGDAAVVVPTGELDLATTPALEEALQRAFEGGTARVVLDLRELEFIDSSGLRTLLTARRRADDARAEFSLVAGHRGLERTLEIAGVHKVFDWTLAEDLA